MVRFGSVEELVRPTPERQKRLLGNWKDRVCHSKSLMYRKRLNKLIEGLVYLIVVLKGSNIILFQFP